MTAFEPCGVIVPMVTPFQNDGALDEEALRRITQHLLEGGVDGLFPAGSTGEFFALSEAERLRVIEVVVQECAGRLPVYAGTGAVGTRQVIEFTRQAETLGADAVVVITPFYIAPSQHELYEHYATIAKSTRLPVIPYNNPSRTGGVNLTPATVERLAEIPNLVGIKDSAGDMQQFAEFVRLATPGFAVMQGRDDAFYESFKLGAVGAVAAIGNVCPEVVVEIYQAFRAGRLEQAEAAQEKVTRLRHALSLATFPAVLKAAMSMVGQPVGDPRSPVLPLTRPVRDELRDILIGVGLTITA